MNQLQAQQEVRVSREDEARRLKLEEETSADMALLRAILDAVLRAREVEAAGELARREGLIVACGGGLPLRPAAMDPLRETGTVIFLARDPGETYDAESMAGRPLAQDGRAAFLARFRQREPVYRAAAHHTVTNFSDPETTVQTILEVLDI